MNMVFRFTFDELGIVPAELEELLGFDPGASPDPFPEMVQTALAGASQWCDIRGGFEIFQEVEFREKEQQMVVNRKLFSPGKIVFTQLRQAQQVALFVCTAGGGFTRWSRQLNDSGDLMMGYVVDALGSLTVDKAGGLLLDRLQLIAEKDGQNSSDSFSPGYCDWSVAEQQTLFSLLPEGFCGVKLSGSSLMDPIKSVSGMVGIGAGLSRKGNQCRWCSDKDCYYGKIRRKKLQDG